LKKIGIVGTNGLPAKYGGWESLVHHLTIKLNGKFKFIVYTSTHNSKTRINEYNGAELRYIRLKANGIQSIFYDLICLCHAARNTEIILVLGSSGCIFFPVIKLFRKKLIFNPDGLEWKRQKWSKPARWFLKVSEKIGVRYADIVVTDNLKIQQYIKDSYGHSSSIVEYGGDHAVRLPMSLDTQKKYNILDLKYAFTVCRIEPENNIHTILEAFMDKSMILVVVGNWNNSKYGFNLRKKYCSCDNFRLLDPIYDQKSLDEIRSNCCMYIHGHSAGGTNPSLVEAMNLGLFIVAFGVEYNIETTEGNALYFNSCEDLVKVIDEFERGHFNTSMIKVKMKEIALRRYTWDEIAKKYSNLFS